MVFHHSNNNLTKITAKAYSNEKLWDIIWKALGVIASWEVRNWKYFPTVKQWEALRWKAKGLSRRVDQPTGSVCSRRPAAWIRNGLDCIIVLELWRFLPIIESFTHSFGNRSIDHVCDVTVSVALEKQSSGWFLPLDQSLKFSFPWVWNTKTGELESLQRNSTDIPFTLTTGAQNLLLSPTDRCPHLVLVTDFCFF